MHGHADSTVHNSQKVETTQMSIKGRMDKQNVVQTHNGILLSHNRNETVIHATVWMNLENIMLSERSQTQKVTYFMIIYVKYLK